MKTQSLIEYLLENPHLETVVINDFEVEQSDAIEYLSQQSFDSDWRINSSLEKNTLIVYEA